MVADIIRGFVGIQVSTSVLALISFLLGALAGMAINGVSLEVVGFILFTIATAAAVAAIAIDPGVLSTGKGRSRAL